MTTGNDEFVMPALQLLSTEEGFEWRIEINADTLAQADYAMEKADRIEIMGTMSKFMGAMVPLLQQAPGSAPLLLTMMKWTIAGFKGASEIEGTIDRELDKLARQAMTPQQKPDPNAGKMQLEQAKMQGQQAIEQAKAQAAATLSQQEHQQQIQVKNAELQMQSQQQNLEMQKMSMEMRLKEQEMQMKIMFERQKLQMEEQAKAMELQFQAALDNVKLVTAQHQASIQVAQSAQLVKQEAAAGGGVPAK